MSVSESGSLPFTKSPGELRVKKGGRRLALQVALAAAALLLVGTCVLFVGEPESVIVERFGNIVHVYDRDGDRGAHLKLPWPIDLVRRFDRRTQQFDPPAREM